MKTYHFLIGLLLTLVSFSSCKKAAKAPLPKAAKLISYSLQKVKNPAILDLDVQASINDQTINLDLPKNTDLSQVVATFEFEGTKVVFNGVEQQSGLTSIALQNGLFYEITGEDGVVKRYELRLNFFDDEDLLIEKFWIDKAVNPALITDIQFATTADSILATTSVVNNKFFKPSFQTKAKTVLINGVEAKSAESSFDFSNKLTLTLISSKGFRRDYGLRIAWVDDVPQLYIVTENNAPIVSKDTYLKATVRIEGKGRYADMAAISTKVKGRGNSTWGYAKKPYRLKLDSKTSLFGLPQAKNWVLLANYLDPTLMLNTVALKMGQMLGVPYTNNFVPVELNVNGQYLGSYLLTEQVEVDENRVNVGDDGMLLEFDSYFDEDYKFKSTNYQLPVNIKFPELNQQSEVAAIQSQFQQLEDLVFSSTFPNNNYLQYLDKEAFVGFLLVNFMADNEEINHPKSTYINKTKNGKFTMGPLWDFDWAWGYEGTYKHFSSATRPLFNTASFGTKPGYKFFTRLMQDPVLKSAFKAKWQWFKTNKLSALLAFVDDYAKLTAKAKQRDYALWNTGNANFMTDVAKLKQYLSDRANYLDTYVAGF